MTRWDLFRIWAFGIRPWRRHSLVLAFAGFIYVLIGLVFVAIPPTGQRAASLELVLRLAPAPVWGIVWIAVGGMTLLSTVWPQTSETWGYTAMSGLASFWAAQFALSVFILGAPYSALNGTLVYGLLAFLWWAISGLKNPGDVAVIEGVSEPW